MLFAKLSSQAPLAKRKRRRVQLPGRITALACKKTLTFAAVGPAIVVCRRASHVCVWRAHEASIVQLLVFGELLLSLCRAGHLALWKMDAATTAPLVRTPPQSFRFITIWSIYKRCPLGCVPSWRSLGAPA